MTDSVDEKSLSETLGEILKNILSVNDINEGNKSTSDDKQQQTEQKDEKTNQDAIEEEASKAFTTLTPSMLSLVLLVISSKSL